jgi:hypothetical protein
MVNKMPVADASVFLNNSRYGTSTKRDGTYELASVKDGQYDLLVSCIGYEPYRQQISVKSGAIKMPDIELMPKINELAEVKIIPGKISRDLKRERYVRLFKDAFLGRTRNAAECKLLNPELLDFDFDEVSEKLTATSPDFLVIENKALGYRIKYLLQSFLFDPRNGVVSYTGLSLFENMSGKPAQEATWVKKRVETYNGSELHFLRACLADAVSDNFFTLRKLTRTPSPDRPSDSLIYVNIKKINSNQVLLGGLNSLNYWIMQAKRPVYEQSAGMPLKTSEYLKRTNERDIYALGYTAPLMINYKHKENSTNRYTSYITFVEPYTYFDTNGVIFTPKNCLIEGYWATLRVADQLPVDYELNK